MLTASPRNLLPIVLAYLPVPIAGAVLSARWGVGATPEGGPGDMVLRGTALEYLEGVLPPDIRDRLWPFLGTSAPVNVGARGREEILADLLRSNDSIVLNLKELRRRGGTGR